MLYPAHGLQTPPAEPTELDQDGSEQRVAHASEQSIHAHAAVIDLRAESEFHRAHIHGSKNFEVQCIANPFKEPKLLAKLWEQLHTVLVPESKGLTDKNVLVVGHNEEVAYVASSVLRKQGVKAFALGGGFGKWAESGFDRIFVEQV